MKHNVLLTLAIGSAEKTHLGKGVPAETFRKAGWFWERKESAERFWLFQCPPGGEGWLECGQPVSVKRNRGQGISVGFEDQCQECGFSFKCERERMKGLKVG